MYKKNKAVFLDRDGVLNFERGYTYHLNDFIVLPGVARVLKQFQDAGFLLIVISNQGGIGKGLYTKEDVSILHQHLCATLALEGVLLSEIYYCPHHPASSRCICRKPDSLLIEKAIAKYDIEPSSSFFIGDKERDIEASTKANVTGILIESNSPLDNILKKILP